MRLYECGYCGKAFESKEHESLEDDRAELVKSIYYIEAHLLKQTYSVDMFLNNETLERYRAKLAEINIKIGETK